MVFIRRTRRAATAALVSLAAVGLQVPATAAPPPPKNSPADLRVTLLTGDRVTVNDGSVTRIEPGKDRKHVGFRTYKNKNHLYVVPSDVQPQLASGRLDRALFDVTGLIKAKYDDRSTSSIPVIVSYAGKAQQRAAVPGASVTRALPAVNGAALKVDKAGPLGLLASTGVQKIWLDGKRRLTLDQSVPQIGAPAAWKAGYTGKGVTVAVLDSGIDKTHPDLATRVVGGKNFTADPDGDQVGHGTHVASTIAGTGTKYRGVAPDAKLYDGKVCDQYQECAFSAIVAGMEWAATEVKANVVNLSLGGLDAPETDPMEEAVNRLTASTGTLFVIAAGNEGPGPGTVGSPGSAEAALTVGAVDKQDQLADFSSRGPRVGDDGLKPDVTAPGVGIVAAKAKDSVIGTPVGDQYLQLNGTSMATPHVAGAAALLAQQHPDWKAAALKGVLMGSAKVIAGQTVLEQGAGRVDVAKGIEQAVFAEPSSLSFGVASFPHDDDLPIAKTLTYRNTGDQPVTLALAATLDGPGGATGSISLSAQSVTVPAGGSSAVQVTVQTRGDGANGMYTGRVTATAGKLSVTAAVAVTKEIPSYNLTVRSTGPDGRPGPPVGFVGDLSDGSMRFLDAGESDQVTMRLPVGTYHLQGGTVLEEANNPEHYKTYTVIQPTVELTKDVTVDLDLRVAKPVKLTVPEPTAVQAFGMVGYARNSPSGEAGFGSAAIVFDNETAYSGQIGPDLPWQQLSGQVLTYWAKPAASGFGFINTPYLYTTLDEQLGRFPTGFTRQVKAAELATLPIQLNGNSDRPYILLLKGSGQHTASGIAFGLGFDQPRSVTAHVEAGPATWATQLDERIDFTDLVTQLRRPAQTYRAGQTYRQRFQAAAFTPAPAYAGRTGDGLAVYVSSLMDADGNKGYTATDTGSAKLLRDGKVIAEADTFGEIETRGLPPESATYTVAMAMTRESYSALSTRTELNWTFRSGATERETLLPMIGLRYQPKVDATNVAQRTPVSVLPFSLIAQPGASVPAIRKLELEVSGDGGKSWRKATVAPHGRDGYQAVFGTPDQAQAISLRAHVTDAQGNLTEETVIAAYLLK